MTSTAADPCADYTDSLLLFISAHRAVYVCEGGQSVMAFFVSFGKKGIFKTKKGDKKTPIGVYSLGTPHPSANYGLFIPVDYPNADDMAQGRTGGDIGFHGPTRRYACEPAVGIFNNWTDGCIAFTSDVHLKRVVQWVSEHPEAYAVLRAQ